jgi:hypothetical protein
LSKHVGFNGCVAASLKYLVKQRGIRYNRTAGFIHDPIGCFFFAHGVETGFV